MKNRIIQLLGGVPRATFFEKVRALEFMRMDHAQSEAVVLDTLKDVQRKLGQAEHDMSEFSKLANEAIETVGQLRSALRDIAACETHNSNGTVRKMARIAREASQ